MQFGSVGDKVEATFNPECKLNLHVLIFHLKHILIFYRSYSVYDSLIKFKNVELKNPM